MKGRGQHQPVRPDSIKGFRVGDRVRTSIGRIAIITGLRIDGYIDGCYEGQHPSNGAVILRPADLVRVT